MDKVPQQKRSENMRRIRSKDTKPEKIVRSALHRCGYRFTVVGPSNRSLPGKPDVVLPRYRIAIFVHGCFWHCHDACREGRIPSSNRGYWAPKLEKNVTRDRDARAALESLSWKVVVFWGCEVEKAVKEVSLNGLIRRRLEGICEKRSVEQIAQRSNIC